MKLVRHIPLPGLLLAAATFVHASSILPLTPSEQVESSGAVFRGTVVNVSCFRDSQGLIHTATSLRVDESLKGTFPSVLKLVYRGGRIANEDQYCDISPRFELDGEYLVFVKRAPDGRLICTQGGASAVRLQRMTGASTQDVGAASFAGAGGQLLAEVRQLTDNGTTPGDDVTDQAGQSGVVSQAAPTGMLGGLATRFTAPDRGEAIPYLIDADSLPAGISLTQATNAVREAFDAWVAVTSLKFRFAGIQSFGQGADTITNEDEVIRIQLHDNYSRINSGSTLGIGGRGSSALNPPGTTWNLGGNVAGNDFWKTTRGYVILESGASAMQVLSTFTEVLCHEIGHSLNMAHSSETQTTNMLLSDAMMFYQAHADGRGAALGDYDPPVIQQMYPSNTPPFSFDRYLDVVTGYPDPPNVPGVNEATLRGYDLQGSSLTLITTNATSGNGTFSQVGNRILYTPGNYYGYNGRYDPGSGSSKDRIFARFSDGTNASPFVAVRVLSFNEDAASEYLPFPPSDGIPDRWMDLYFGHIDPQAGDKSRAEDDADGDKLTNLQEWLLGSDPTDPQSGNRITAISNGTVQFQAKAYELFELEGSTDLKNWTRAGLPIQPTNAPLSVLTDSLGTNITATVSNLPMSGSRMFYRIVKVP